VTIADRVDRFGGWAAVAIGASIPVSVALDNVLLAACLAAWLLGGSYREKLEAARGNVVLLAALALFALLAAGTAWSHGAPGDALRYLAKYSDLLLVAPLAHLLREPPVRMRALRAFAASLGIVLLLSCLIKTGLLPSGRWWLGDSRNAVVFKYHLTHNILMAYGAFLFAELALAARTVRARALMAAAALLAVANVLFMVQGRTGYLVLAALALYFGYRLHGRRGLAASAAASAAIVITLALAPGTFGERWQALASELRAWNAAIPSHTSTGLRLEFYRNTLAIIRDHPLLGVGTGGFPKAYEDRVSGTGVAETRNPHNEYLHIAVQLGLPGLALLLFLFHVQWRNAPRLPSTIETHLARGLVLTMVVGCLFNSMLLDHTEGLMFAWLTATLFTGLPPAESGN